MQLLLVHGLGRTPLSLFGLAGALRHAGHRTRFFGYLPALEPLPRIVRRLAAQLRALATRGEPVGLVGHSLGGLFLRKALAEVPELRVHHFVMLGTPHTVPRMARLAWRWFPPFRLFTRDCGKLLTSADALANLPPLAVPFALIAGTAGPCGRFSPFGTDANDGVVAVAETRLNGTEPELFPAVHTLMMDAVAIRARILAIMEKSEERTAHPVPAPGNLAMPTNAKNVLGGPLQTCSTNPLTGFYRDGCCNTGAEDEGLHTICCHVTAEFLAHQQYIGNDLSTPFPTFGFPGLRPGDRWCVCITRWKMSLEAGMACPVVLEATHMHALEYVDLEDLQRHAVSSEKKA